MDDSNSNEPKRHIPDLSELYEDLKDKYTKLKREFMRTRKINKELQVQNEMLLLRAMEAERMINEQILRNVRQSAADEGMDPRQSVIDKYLGRSKTNSNE